MSIVPGRGLAVSVVDNDIEFALRLFKKVIKDSGKLIDMKSKSYYIKPSVKRRETKKRAAYFQKRFSFQEK